MDNKSFVLGLALGAVALGATMTMSIARPGGGIDVARNANPAEVSMGTMDDEVAYLDTSDLAAQIKPTGPVAPAPAPAPTAPTAPLSSSSSSSRPTSSSSAGAQYWCDNGQCVQCSTQGCSGWSTIDQCRANCATPLSSSSSSSKPTSSSSAGAQYWCENGQCVQCTQQGCSGQSYDQCRANCATPQTCGNGIIEVPEECDDGNTNNNDSCTNLCQVSPICNPTQPYDAFIYRSSIYYPNSQVAPGATGNYAIHVKNMGTETWSWRNPRVQLGSWNPWNNTTFGVSRGFVRWGDEVRPCDEYIFELPLQMPLIPGFYNFQWRMVLENQYFFGKASPVEWLKVL